MWVSEQQKKMTWFKWQSWTLELDEIDWNEKSKNRRTAQEAAAVTWDCWWPGVGIRPQRLRETWLSGKCRRPRGPRWRGRGGLQGPFQAFSSTLLRHFLPSLALSSSVPLSKSEKMTHMWYRKDGLRPLQSNSYWKESTMAIRLFFFNLYFIRL